MTDLAPASRANELHSAAPKKGPGRPKGVPDTKPRKRRTDNPARFLPGTVEAHRIARERGKQPHRSHGSRNGYTQAEQELGRELARAKAKLEVDFWAYVGEWPTPEQRARLYRSINPDLLARAAAMESNRAIRLATAAAKKVA